MNRKTQWRIIRILNVVLFILVSLLIFGVKSEIIYVPLTVFCWRFELWASQNMKNES